MDGRPTSAAPVSSAPVAPLRIRFAPPWPLHQTRSFAFDYDLGRVPGDAAVGASPSGFHLADPDALPRWIPPPGVFVTADSRARKEEVQVTMPSEFLVLAAGREQRPTQQGDLTVHRFVVTPKSPPFYVVAGHYQESRIPVGKTDVIFWTVDTLDAQSAASAAARLAGTVALYDRAFGPTLAGSGPVRIVEIPAGSTPNNQNEDNEGEAASFPRGALIAERAFAKAVASPVGIGLQDDRFLELAESELARTWFGWLTRPRPAARLLMGRGASLWAVVFAAEARGGAAARREAVMHLLAAYDAARERTDDTPLIAAPEEKTPDQLAVNGYRAALFWVALEDTIGSDKLQAAARHVVQAMAGHEMGQEELRSAVESEAGRGMQNIFRDWMDHLGIPADFRARYSAHN
jgi:hypothetical protein